MRRSLYIGASDCSASYSRARATAARELQPRASYNRSCTSSRTSSMLLRLCATSLFFLLRRLACAAEATAVQVRRRAHERWSAPQRGAHECRARCMLRELSHAHDSGRSGAVSAVPCRCPAAQAVTRTSSGALRRSSRSRWQCCVAALDGGARARRRPLWCCECSALQVPCSTSRDTHQQRSPSAQFAFEMAVLRCRARWRRSRTTAAALVL